jgi:predicted ester cyclase
VHPEELALTHLRAMSTGDLALAEQAIHPEHVNHMAPDHPPASALPGLPGFMATSAWLRFAFADLTYEVMDLVSDGHRTTAYVTMTGRQHGPFVIFPPRRSAVAFPPTGKPFAARQCHIFTIRDGQHGDHSAVRDDLGMMTQLGHLPPSPAVAARMARFALTGARTRAVRDALRLAQLAADDTPHTAASPARNANQPDRASQSPG